MRGCTHATPIIQQEDSAAHHTPPSNLGNIDPPTACHWPTIPFFASDSTILEAKFNDTNFTLWADAGRQEKTNTQSAIFTNHPQCHAVGSHALTHPANPTHHVLGTPRRAVQILASQARNVQGRRPPSPPPTAILSRRSRGRRRGGRKDRHLGRRTPADEDPQAPAPGLHIPPGPGGSASCSGTLVTTTFASRTSIVREYRAFSTPFGS
ncbi:hypothetical protein CPLU01_04532 [Colletotrichum plurivorum]|uniref:Uncharacterized protein n=1 Tax=Colletotrichum plurivorum TaxID=2175906 RepID=A0A8H6NIW7_9PEZI|nr:hypothetical protein CPLU01_04532 [Colletotrichum plurivorum]